MKLGYKGFDGNLCAGLGRGPKHQFVIGETYSKLAKEKPAVCSSDGFHYCNDLVTVFNHYPLNGDNRFCEVEILGDFTDSLDKSITTSLKIIRELEKEEIYKHIYEENLNIQVLKDIQTKYPYFHVGGSVGLFLHGVRLSRWVKSTKSDIDLVAPFFILPEGKIGDEDVEYINGKASANDFDETFIVGGTKERFYINLYKKKGHRLTNFLGGGLSPQMLIYKLTYDEAKNEIRKLNIKTTLEWRKKCKTKEIPPQVPRRPDLFYINNGWVSWSDWLGVEIIANKDKEFLNYESCKSYVHQLNLKTNNDWRVYCNSGNRPKNIPSNPDLTFRKNGWISWYDWLGTK